MGVYRHALSNVKLHGIDSPGQQSIPLSLTIAITIPYPSTPSHPHNQSNIFHQLGPTLFSPVIYKAMDLAKEAQKSEIEQQQYFVLLILTDGIISDMQKTINAYVKAYGDGDGESTYQSFSLIFSVLSKLHLCHFPLLL